jgi:hypothetical protein
MNNESSIALLSKGKSANISPEKLEMMGKEAANIFIEKHISLNESISKLAAAHDDISQEQIKRVCEFANTAVYLAKHDMAKTAGSSSSYPEFDLADPNRVIQDLSDGTKSTVTTKVDADYSRLPQKVKTSSAEKKVVRIDRMKGANGKPNYCVHHYSDGTSSGPTTTKTASPAEMALEELFTSKTAEDLDYSKDTAVNEVMAAKEQLIGLRDHLRSAGEQFDLLRKESASELYELSKRFMMDGGSFADIGKVAYAVSQSQDEMANLLDPIIKGLLKEKVSSASELKLGIRGMEKVAHRTVNPEHPMMKVAAAVLVADREMEKVAQGLKEVTAGLNEVNSFIKEQLRAG